jgi:alpha-amylase
VWISPIAKGVEGTTKYGENFHGIFLPPHGWEWRFDGVGYWSTDLLSVNPHFGTVADLINLSQEVHKRGMVPLLSHYTFISYLVTE